MKLIIEIQQTGTGLPPDDASGVSLNSVAVWVRVGGDPGAWQPSPRRSLLLTADDVVKAVRAALEPKP